MSAQRETITSNEAETIALAARLAAMLRAGDVVALHGELGAGKTRFVRGLVAGLGFDPTQVSSPTFVIVNEYEQPAKGSTGSVSGLPLIHVDAYRLEETDDLESLGWDRIVESDAIIAVEWAERIAEHLPADRFDVTIEHAGDDHRRITVSPPPGRRVAL